MNRTNQKRKDRLTYIIVGSGWRAEFFGRVARTYPEIFQAVFLCRSEEKARRMKASTGIDAVLSEEEALSIHPDFVVVAVDRVSLVDLAEHWTRKGACLLSLKRRWGTAKRTWSAWNACRPRARGSCAANSITAIRYWLKDSG